MTLIVDDDQVTCDTLSRLLRLEGFSPATALSGTECLTKVAGERPDALVVDLILPDMHGLEVVRRLRASGLNIPFVVISGNAKVPDAVEAIRLGAMEVFEKPFDSDGLVAVLKSVRQPSLQAPPAIGDETATQLVAAATQDLESRGHHANPERWALCVLRAAVSKEDLKTLEVWAKRVGTNYTSLRELCYLMDVSPLAARDFARGFRAIVWVARYGTPLATLIDASNRRALDKFCRQAGLPAPVGSPEQMIRAYLSRQQFISAGSPGLVAIQSLFPAP